MSTPHKLKHDARGVAQFCMDYMRMTKKPESAKVVHPILVLKETVTGGTWALATIRKMRSTVEWQSELHV